MIDYPHHSPSRLNLYCAEPAMFVLEYVLGERQLVGPPAHRGSAVEDAITHGLNNAEAPLSECVAIAMTVYDNKTALSADARRAKYRDGIPDMVSAALGELRAYGKPTSTQGLIEWKPNGLKFPIIGYYDYRWDNHGVIADLKTTEKMPSSIKIPHARQVALYAASDNVDARLIYVTPKKIEPYVLENVFAHRNALLRIAQTVERFLALSDDPQVLVSLVVPDLDSFYWKDPAMRQRAFEIWGV
jgi:hypothetical protein